MFQELSSENHKSLICLFWLIKFKPLNDKIANFTISLCMALTFWPPLQLTGTLEVIGGDSSDAAYLHHSILAHWVGGQRCSSDKVPYKEISRAELWHLDHTRRKEWKRYVSLAWNIAPKVASSSGASFCLVLFFCSVWCSLFWFKVFFFFISTMALLSSWFQRLKLLSPFFVAWAVSDCPCHGCFVLHRPSLTHVKEKGEKLHQSLPEMDSPPLD